MSLFAQIAVGIVALLHIVFLAYEMFLWETPRAMKAFGTNPEFAKSTKVMAANQGLYNGFLAAGLLWSIWPIGTGGAGIPIAVFFLNCIIVAGLYGGLTVKSSIVFVQALPALIALGLVLSS